MEVCILDKDKIISTLSEEILGTRQWLSPEEILSDLVDVIIFGTGGAAESVTNVLQSYKINILCYVDNDPKKQDTFFHGKPVLAPEKITNSPNLVLIASLWARDIAKQLHQLECKYLDFSFCVDFQRWARHFDFRNFDARKAFDVGNEFLSGQDLKYYLGCIRYRQTYDPLELFPPNHDHYMNPHVLPTSDDIYIDGGSWQGDTLNELKAACGEDIEVHCFEPDDENYKILLKHLKKEKNQRLYIVKKALWSKSTTLRFVTSAEAIHSMQSRVCKDKNHDQQVTEVPATAIDDYTKLIPNKPSYIKMDIEGAEPQALEGAYNLLNKFPPKLAISAYHEPNHLWQLIEQIHSINPDYKFWFTHHSQHLFESVIYAKKGS